MTHANDRYNINLHNSFRGHAHPEALKLFAPRALVTLRLLARSIASSGTFEGEPHQNAHSGQKHDLAAGVALLKQSECVAHIT
jgi:hypothetical protein